MSGRTEAVHVLEAFPELGAGLDETELALAGQETVAPACAITSGVVAQLPDAASGSDPPLGLLILEGLLTREVTVGRVTSAELLGRGDLLRPWDWVQDGAPVRSRVRWTALTPVRLAVLDRGFVAAACRWPALMDAVVALAVRRSSSLALYQATSHHTGVANRLQMLFETVASRWGQAERDGIVVPIPLTHQTLARLVGAQRPSVTTALSTLARSGALTRRPGGAWVVHPSQPATPAASG